MTLPPSFCSQPSKQPERCRTSFFAASAADHDSAVGSGAATAAASAADNDSGASAASASADGGADGGITAGAKSVGAAAAVLGWMCRWSGGGECE